MAYLFMILSWAIFYSLHTALAASKLKRFLQARWPQQMKWYRLFYSILSTVLIIGIVVQAVFLPQQGLFGKTPESNYIGYMLAAVGVIILNRSLKKISLRIFVGLSNEETSNHEPLQISDIYSFVRHPLYLGLLFIFVGYFLVSGNVGALIHLACLVIYLPIGIYFEEKNLVATYGEAYRKYQQEVPAFFPIPFKKKRA